MFDDLSNNWGPSNLPFWIDVDSYSISTIIHRDHRILQATVQRILDIEGWWLTAGTTWTWSEERSFRIISFASCPVLPTRCSQFGCEPCSCNSSGSIKEFSGEFFSIEVVKDFSEDSWTEETINWRDERKRPMIIRDLKNISENQLFLKWGKILILNLRCLLQEWLYTYPF